MTAYYAIMLKKYNMSLCYRYKWTHGNYWKIWWIYWVVWIIGTGYDSWWIWANWGFWSDLRSQLIGHIVNTWYLILNLIDMMIRVNCKCKKRIIWWNVFFWLCTFTIQIKMWPQWFLWLPSLGKPLQNDSSKTGTETD